MDCKALIKKVKLECFQGGVNASLYMVNNFGDLLLGFEDGNGKPITQYTFLVNGKPKQVKYPVNFYQGHFYNLSILVPGPVQNIYGLYSVLGTPNLDSLLYEPTFGGSLHC